MRRIMRARLLALSERIRHAATRSQDPILLLQRMDRALVRAFLEVPDVLTEEIAPWRDTVVRALTGPLRIETDPEQRLVLAREAYVGLEAEQDVRRSELVERHRIDFSATELDAEIGYKSLVLVLGGGGGAGFVYLGAMQRLLAAGKVPDYVIGASIGAVLGSVLARAVPVPMDDYDDFAAPMFERPDGQPMRMDDLAIPYDAVVAGVHQQLFSRLPHQPRARCRRVRPGNGVGQRLPRSGDALRREDDRADLVGGRRTGPCRPALAHGAGVERTLDEADRGGLTTVPRRPA